MNNPAADPVPVQDVEGDGRWLSMVCMIINNIKNNSFNILHKICLNSIHIINDPNPYYLWIYAFLIAPLCFFIKQVLHKK